MKENRKTENGMVMVNLLILVANTMKEIGGNIKCQEREDSFLNQANYCTMANGRMMILMGGELNSMRMSNK